MCLIFVSLCVFSQGCLEVYCFYWIFLSSFWCLLLVHKILMLLVGTLSELCHVLGGWEGYLLLWLEESLVSFECIAMKWHGGI